MMEIVHPVAEPIEPLFLVGKTEEEALSICLQAKRPCRVTRRGDERLIVTADYRPERINLRIVDGKVYGIDPAG